MDTIPGIDTIPKWFLHSAQARQPEGRPAERAGHLAGFPGKSLLQRETRPGAGRDGPWRGDRICIVGDNDRYYLWGDLGVMAAGATVVGIFTDRA
jgi:hypothetical protein